MLSNRVAFAALAFACVSAAGAGAYLAMRQNAGAPVAAVTAEAPVAPSVAPTNVAKPVQETEAVVGEPRTAPKPSSGSAEPSRERRREDARATPTRQTARVSRSPEATIASAGQLPTLDRSWPSGQAPATPSTPTPASVVEPPAQVSTSEEHSPEPPRAVEPPVPAFEELVVSADSVVGVQLENALSSETARVEDPIEARVTRDVRVGGAVAIPAGSRTLGSVTLVERGGKFKERARLGIRFHTLVLADGTRVPVTTETIYRYGEAPGQASAAKIGGGAVLGAIIGGIAGGAKGAAIGAATGSGAGTAAVAVGDRNAATFTTGSEITARILSPVTVTIEK